MPIRIDISVNDKPITSFHVARISKSSGRVREKTYEYAVLEKKPGEEVQTDDEWMTGDKFEHAYGAGIVNCVREGFNAFLTGEEARKAQADPTER